MKLSTTRVRCVVHYVTEKQFLGPNNTLIINSTWPNNLPYKQCKSNPTQQVQQCLVLSTWTEKWSCVR